MAKSKINDILDSVETYHRFMVFIPTRTIKLESEIDNDNGDEHGVSFSMSSYFLKNLTILESISLEPITIIFSTNGGEIEQGLAIYDAIKASPCKITMKIYGCAYSMGSIILQAADHRVLSPHSAIMYHDGASFAAGNSSETVNMALHNQILGKQCDDILFERINEKRVKDDKALMSRQSFNTSSLKSKWLTAAEAVELGLADAIDTSPIGG